MARDLSKPLREITFHCNACAYGHTFKASPASVVDAPAEAHHPFAYFAPCPRCKSECQQVEWERNLVKAWANATGPKTPEGKAAAARNLEGHPTPEEALRTRFNAMKHGMNARVAKYFPAKPDKYSFCAGCEVDRIWCAQQPACVHQTENFLLHHAAFEQRNPKVLQGVYADFHAVVFSLLQQILQTIMADGVKLVAPEWYYDPKSNMKVACTVHDPVTGEERTIYKIEAHPLFKPLAELLSRTGLTLADMGMTAKEMDDRDDGELGYLAGTEPAALEAFTEQQATTTRALENALRQAQQDRDADPQLLEYRRQMGEGNAA